MNLASESLIISDKIHKNNYFIDNDSISGEVVINLEKFGIKEFEHSSITIELNGMMSTEGYRSELININKVIQSTGTLTKNSNFGFNFKEVNFPYPTFKGNLAEIKYSLKASITKNFLNLAAHNEKEIVIISLENERKKNVNVKITSEMISDTFSSIISHINNNEYIKGNLIIKEIYNLKNQNRGNYENVEIECINVHLKMREILISKIF